MTTPTVAEYLKYANLQMAAEAFLALPNGTLVENVRQALIDGNLHATKFTATQATIFSAIGRSKGSESFDFLST